MIRSIHILLLLYMTCILLLSAQVWGQDINNQANIDDIAMDFSNMKPADVLINNDHKTTTTMANTVGEFIDEETDQNNDDDDPNDDDEEDDMDGQVGTTYDIDQEPLGDGSSSSSGYYGLLHQGNSKEQEQGDDLGEELFGEYDEEDDEEDNTDRLFTSDSSNNNNDNKDGLLFEDDEAPLDFKNNEKIDLDQLLFEASQKDTTTTGWDYQQQHDPLDKTATHGDIDQLLANADDALYVDPQDDDAMDVDEHLDHVTDTLVDSIFQDQQQNMNPLNDENHHHAGQDDDALLLPPLPAGIFAEHDTPDDQLDYSSNYQNHQSQYKLPLFGILVLLILLYKVSNKSQGGIGSKFLEKEEKGLPLHNQDLNTQDSMSYPSSGSILATSPITAMQQNQQQQQHQQQQQQQSTSSSGHGYLGRRSSSSASMSSGRKSSLSGVAASAVGVHGGHTRRISLGHPMLPHTIKESKWEGEWDDKAEKRRQ